MTPGCARNGANGANAFMPVERRRQQGERSVVAIPLPRNGSAVQSGGVGVIDAM
ncbi:hypothetical protein O979_07135 [Mycobacterium avium subsp. paratuberculosis 10-4404]|nr:hypothetical protein O979_07135 [Mycobacterium avium subsp. paratuberculosis 10-4404]ETB12950.1 hypothetical protein O980_07035 [Mycobacterium avium subsp. paratuberculosis 08-8281]